MCPQSDAPRYIHAIIIVSCLYALELILMISWRTYYVLENKRRNKVQEAEGIDDETRLRLGALNAELGMTDKSEWFLSFPV